MPEAGSIATRRILSGWCVGDLLDLHAAFGGGDDGDAAGGAIDQEREIKFAGDVAAGFDVDAVHGATRGPGLFGDQRVAEHGIGGGADLFGRTGEADASLAVRVVCEMAGAAATGVDLRLHHVDRAGEFAAAATASSGVQAT